MNATTFDAQKLERLRKVDGSIAKGNSRTESSPAARGLGGAARRIEPYQARASARQLSFARTHGRGKNGNGGRADEPDFRRGKIIPLRYVGISNAGIAGPAAWGATWRNRLPGRGARTRGAKDRCLFDEAEKAHPRVLDILLQLLDAARITVATGQTLDFSGFYVWLTSNIGSAELMSLQHSNDATLERHVLSRAQQALRPEIFARITEKLVFDRLSYEHQLEIAEKFLAREIEFLAARGSHPGIG